MTNKEQLTQEVKRLNRAFNSYDEKELKAFYNTIKGMVKKAYNRLEEVQKGNVKTKRYQYLAGSESPAKKALEKQGGLLKDWKDVNPFKSKENNDGTGMHGFWPERSARDQMASVILINGKRTLDKLYTYPTAHKLINQVMQGV